MAATQQVIHGRIRDKNSLGGKQNLPEYFFLAWKWPI